MRQPRQSSRPRRLFWRLLVSALAPAVMSLATASAQQIPPPEPGPAITTATFANNQIDLRDAATNAPLVVQRGYPLIENQDPAVTCNISFQAQPSGFDLIFDMFNTAPVDKALGVISVGIITLGPDISYMDIREGIDPMPVNVATYAGWALEYPTYVYSPAFILINQNYAMSVTLQYPILEYEHHVTLNLDNPRGQFLTGEGGQGWSGRFSLSTNGPYAWQHVDHGAVIKPGEFRRYVMSVRVTKNPAEWIRTMLPYRNYFLSMYGGVRYQRTDTPVWGVLASVPAQCAAANPLGWNSVWRQDINGWSGMATLLREQTGGWGGSMVWLPGGSYWQNPQNNFPCTPASTWLSSPVLSTIFDPVTGMPSVSAAGKDLGFWWGRSCQTAATWDPPVLEDFDPDNPVHYARQLNELDLMARAGATMIGLDTFDPLNMPFWKQYRWVMTMRLRYPNIKFITEPTNCDIMATLAANFITGWEMHKIPVTEDDCYIIRHPNYLADFLVPGHEFWASFAYGRLYDYFGLVPDMNRVMTDMQRFADAGYRPCFSVQIPWWGLTLPPNNIHAAKTWLTSVPADLQISDEPVPLGGLSTGSRPSRSGGNVVAGWRPARPGPAPPPTEPPQSQ